jgi:uncharacterized SAM-binding protein YcdF (DUF218 family)
MYAGGSPATRRARASAPDAPTGRHQRARQATSVRHVSWRARLTILAIVALAGVYAAVLLDVYQVAQRESAASADAAVVLGAAQWNGAPSPVFRARLDHAAALWHDGRVRWVIVTGGVGEGDVLSEAEVGMNYLAALGLPADRILAEPGGSTTLASIRAARQRVQVLGGERVLLVSDPFHMKRALQMAEDLHLRAEPSPVRAGPFQDAPIAVLQHSAREAAGFLIYLVARV